MALGARDTALGGIAFHLFLKSFFDETNLRYLRKIEQKIANS